MTKKPHTLKSDLAHLPPALSPLVTLEHWVLWRWELRKGAWTKPPYDATILGAHAKNNDPETWSSYQITVAAVLHGGKFDGIGFMLLGTAFDVVDLDHCLDPATRKVDAWAQEWVDAANGAYIEHTPSGEGLRIIAIANKSEKLHRRFSIAGEREKAGIEVYRNCERYITVTGAQVGDCKKLAQLDLLEKIKAHYGGAKKNGSSGSRFDFNDAGGASIDYDEIIKNGAPAGADASALFHGVVGHLSAKGMSIDQIVAALSEWPNGIGQRYVGRLRQEVERSFEKWESKRKIDPDKSKVEPEEENKWDGVNKKGIPNPTCTNARRALRALSIACRYDVFHDDMLVGDETLRDLSNLDHTVLLLREKIHKAFGFDPGANNTRDAVTQLCLKREFNPVRDYLDALQWDETPRLECWTVTYLGAKDTELNREFGRLALIAAVRRVRRPGTKFDQIIVLEGEMGKEKSMSIELMAGTENFSDQTIFGLNDQKQQEHLAGIWLYEIAELSRIRKTEVEAIKAFAARTHDRARPAYGHFLLKKPRTCILFATTNESHYLIEADRRFWPIATGKIDIKALKRDRDQLWAEAARREAEGVSIVLRSELWGAARVEQEAREGLDPWVDLLSDVIGTEVQGEEHVFSRDLFELVLGVQKSRLTDRDSKRLGRCMRRLGWDGPKDIRIGDKNGKGYRRSV